MGMVLGSRLRVKAAQGSRLRAQAKSFEYAVNALA
jgi:hypothetical protein